LYHHPRKSATRPQNSQGDAGSIEKRAFQRFIRCCLTTDGLVISQNPPEYAILRHPGTERNDRATGLREDAQDEGSWRFPPRRSTLRRSGRTFPPVDRGFPRSLRTMAPRGRCSTPESSALRSTAPRSFLERATALLPFFDSAPTSSTPRRNGTGTGRETQRWPPSFGQGVDRFKV
jgi:hypothetical protein